MDYRYHVTYTYNCATGVPLLRVIAPSNSLWGLCHHTKELAVRAEISYVEERLQQARAEVDKFSAHLETLNGMLQETGNGVRPQEK